MNFNYGRRFLKDLAALPQPYRTQIENLAFVELPSKNADTLFGMISKMRGYEGFYKIRMLNFGGQKC